MNHRVLIIIPASVQKDCIQVALQYDPAGGQFTFSSPLTSDGTNITHYWASTVCGDNVYDKILELQKVIPGSFAKEYNLFDNPNFTQDSLKELGLTRYVTDETDEERKENLELNAKEKTEEEEKL